MKRESERTLEQLKFDVLRTINDLAKMLNNGTSAGWEIHSIEVFTKTMAEDYDYHGKTAPVEWSPERMKKETIQLIRQMNEREAEDYLIDVYLLLEELKKGEAETENEKKLADEELRETYKRLIHQMVDDVDDVERLKEIYTFALP